jgi:hypothetical protein
LDLYNDKKTNTKENLSLDLFSSDTNINASTTTNDNENNNDNDNNNNNNNNNEHSDEDIDDEDRVLSMRNARKSLTLAVVVMEELLSVIKEQGKILLF